MPGWIISLLAFVAVGIANALISLGVTESYRLGNDIVSGNAQVTDGYEAVREASVVFNNGPEFTDFTVFFCSESSLAEQQADRLLATLEDFNFRPAGVFEGPRTRKFGEGKKQQVKLLSGASQVFSNHTTVFYDEGHPEIAVLPPLLAGIYRTPELPFLQVLSNQRDNTGASETPWRLSVLIC